MRIAVTDACIFIDLLECQACDPFFQLSLEMVTTYQVWRELDEEHREVLHPWVDKGELVMIKIRENFVGKIQSKDLSLSSSLSVTDLSVWYIADKNDDILLTSDGTLRKMAKRHKIKTHGLLWIFDQMYQEEILKPKQLIFKLEYIFDKNRYYRTDEKLYKAFNRLKDKWNR